MPFLSPLTWNPFLEIVNATVLALGALLHGIIKQLKGGSWHDKFQDRGYVEELVGSNERRNPVSVIEISQDADKERLTARVYISGEDDQELYGNFVVDSASGVEIWTGEDNFDHPFTLILHEPDPNALGGFWQSDENTPYAWVAVRDTTSG